MHTPYIYMSHCAALKKKNAFRYDGEEKLAPAALFRKCGTRQRATYVQQVRESSVNVCQISGLSFHFDIRLPNCTSRPQVILLFLKERFLTSSKHPICGCEGVLTCAVLQAYH